MYLFLSIFVILFAVSFLIATLRKLTLKQLLTEAGYQCYYYFLGGKAIVEDHVYVEYNKTHLLPRRGEVAVVTGGARGIGVEIVKKFLQCDMHVIIGCRNVEAGEKLEKKIRACGITSGEISCFMLDVASFNSIKKFSELVLEHVPRVDLLINNAGIMFVPFAKTEDGFESHFAVNYLGHCLLTHLLLPRMVETAKDKGTNGRIVNVSSCAHLAGSIDFEDLSMSTHYIPSASYAQSKLAQILFTKSLDSKLKSQNMPVQVHAVHPGIVNTDLFDGTLLKVIAPWVLSLMFKTPEQGAITIVHACLSPQLEGLGGSYISNCRETSVSPSANDQKIQAKLWEVMLSLIGVEKFGDLLV
ncbi:polyprenol dehydrogenase-like [Periplaneta americana]|uniref:polyprenol dehydrogenase-like n=1 Tax=Periplaneta americana TaxID=6978 RepID=UPI0037E7618E